MTSLHSDDASNETRSQTPSRPQFQDVEEDMSFLDFLIILFQRKKLIAIVTGIVVLLAAIISFIIPSRYTSTVIVLPPQSNSTMSSALSMQMAGSSAMANMASSALGLKNINEMYVSMLKSRSVEDAVIQHYGLMNEYHKKYLADARKELERHAKIDGTSKDGLIRLSFYDQNPSRSAEIANGYVEQFRNLSKSLAVTEASQRRVIFERQVEKTKMDLSNADEALKQTQLNTGMVQVDSQARAMIESAARLRAEMVAKQVQIEAMRTYAAPENPALTEAEGELSGLRAQFGKLVGTNGTASDDLFLPKGKVPEAGLEYLRKLRDVKYYEAVFDVLARQLEIAKLDEAREGAFIQIVDPAVPPEQKSFPRRGLILLGSAATGFTLGIMLALLQGGLARMQADPIKREKLTLLKRSLWMNSSAEPTMQQNNSRGPEIQPPETAKS